MNTKNNTVKSNLLDERNFLSPLQNNILKILEESGPLPRREIVKQLNSYRTTIYANLLKLQKKRIVEKFTRNTGKRGRPLVLWRLC